VNAKPNHKRRATHLFYGEQGAKKGRTVPPHILRGGTSNGKKKSQGKAHRLGRRGKKSGCIKSGNLSLKAITKGRQSPLWAPPRVNKISAQPVGQISKKRGRCLGSEQRKNTKGSRFGSHENRGRLVPRVVVTVGNSQIRKEKTPGGSSARKTRGGTGRYWLKENTKKKSRLQWGKGNCRSGQVGSNPGGGDVVEKSGCTPIS